MASGGLCASSIRSGKNKTQELMKKTLQITIAAIALSLAGITASHASLLLDPYTLTRTLGSAPTSVRDLTWGSLTSTSLALGDGTTLTLSNFRDDGLDVELIPSQSGGNVPFTVSFTDLDWVGDPTGIITGVSSDPMGFVGPGSVSFTDHSVTLSGEITPSNAGKYAITFQTSHTHKPVPEPTFALSLILVGICGLRRSRQR